MENPVLQHNFEISLVESSVSEASALGAVVLGNVIDQPSAAFAECTGLEYRIETDDYEEGGRNGATLKFPRFVKDGEVTLRRGVYKNNELFDWIDSFRQGRGKRRDGVITLRDSEGRPHTVWRILRSFPVRYEGPSLMASETGVAVEELTLAHEGLLQDPGLGIIGGLVRDTGNAIRGLF